MKRHRIQFKYSGPEDDAAISLVSLSSISQIYSSFLNHYYSQSIETYKFLYNKMFYRIQNVFNKHIIEKGTICFRKLSLLFVQFLYNRFWETVRTGDIFFISNVQAFSKKQIDDRKEWLTHFMEDRRQRKLLGLPEVKILYILTPGWLNQLGMSDS